MNHHDDDEALARLRRADPATGSHPDLHGISERLRRRTPLGRSTEDGFSIGPAEDGFAFTSESGGAVRVHEPGPRTSRVGMAAAAAVVAAAVGVGGYALGLDTGRGDLESAVASAEREARASDASEVALVEADQEAAVEGAEEGAALGMDSAVGSSEWASGDDMGWTSGPAVPVASEGLSQEGGAGEVLAMVAPEGDPHAEVTALATALGLDGEADGDDNYASVYDASDGRSLSYYSYGSSGALDYNDPALDPYCAEEGMGWVGPEAPTDLVCAEAAEPPSAAQATALVHEFAAQAGLPTEGLKFEVADEMGGMLTLEGPESGAESGSGDGDAGLGEAGDGDAEPGDSDAADATSSPDLIGVGQDALESLFVDPWAQGPPTVTVLVTDPTSPAPGHTQWHFQVAADGISYASIPLTDYRSLGEYAVISPADAVDRISDPRYAQVGVHIPDLEYDGYEWLEEWDDSEPATAPDPGQPIPYPVTEATVTGAELHQGLLSLWDGSEYVVPTYHLTDGQGNSWQVLALAEDALDFAP